MSLNRKTTRLGLISLLLIAGSSLASCRYDHPGRNHPRGDGHGEHRNYLAGPQHR
jgi:hypothetical protein